MIDTIKSEFRKLITIRSTYIMCGLVLLLVVFACFYVDGIRGAGALALNRQYLANQAIQAVGVTSILTAIVGLLVMTHEYRHNLITYTLTASRSRTQVLLAKILVISGFAIAFTLLVALVAPLMTYLGAVAVKGVAPAPQEFPVWSMLWRIIFFGWAYSMYALIFATLLRNQVGAIAAFLFTPITIEPLLGVLLKHNVMYLPYNAVTQVLSGAMTGIDGILLTPGKAALIALIYIAAGWLLAWAVFIRRDAN